MSAPFFICWVAGKSCVITGAGKGIVGELTLEKHLAAMRKKLESKFVEPVYEESNGIWRAVRPLRNGYRLPTEAEWAWASRFAERDENATFSWGNAMPPPDRSGNFADVTASSILQTHLVTYNDGFDVAGASGTFPANPAGIFDLGGNVSEWVQDYWEVGQPQTETVSVDRLGPEDGRFHVFRGSSWRSSVITELRLAYRNYSETSREDLGFRIARNLE